MPFRFFDPNQRVTVTHGHLPHWDQEDATYFITWRLADSIPRDVFQRWTRDRSRWLEDHGINPSDPNWKRLVDALHEDQRDRFRQFARQLESELDQCHGSCVLKAPNIGAIVAKALHHFDGVRYALGDYVIMPNHVHVLVGGLRRNAMLEQVSSWKKWSAIQINRTLGRKGRLWQDESFDHLVRNEASFAKLREYIADNPKRARLPKDAFLHWRHPD